MGLAPYFAKSAQAASRILHGFDPAGFADTLATFPVGIAWDTRASTIEGRATLDLVVDLIARLYPEIRVAALDENARSLVAPVVGEARRINPNVGIREGLEDTRAIVVIGVTSVPSAAHAARAIYAGSREWEAHLSFSRPAGSGNSDNVFGAGVAGCLAAAAVFRHAFASQLGESGQDADLRVSVLDLSPTPLDDQCPFPQSAIQSKAIDLGELHLVGIGAIGHGAIWALRRTSWVGGTLFLIDGDRFDDTNAQRYVETGWDEAGPKPTVAAARRWVSSNLVLRPIETRWAEHISDFTAANGHWRIDRVALALDNVRDRIMAQAALPRHIYNSWTRAENLGVSRHDFLNGPCVSCIYFPNGARPNDDELVAHALGMTEKSDIERVRLYLDTGTPLDRISLDWIADQMNVRSEIRARLSEFEGKPITKLYSRGICGGLLLVDGVDTANAPVDVPMAFQSALAGILLAAEVIIDAGGLRDKAMPPITEMNLLRRLAARLNRPELASDRCICRDEDFRDTFRAKYALI